MSWGNKLIVVFIVFAGLMGTLVYACMQENFELVSKEYYNDELRYQDKIDGATNANKITPVVIGQTAEQVSIQFPKELQGMTAKGEAWFYCATNAGNDRKIPIALSEDGLFTVPKSLLVAARYQVKLYWTIGADKYYTEQTFSVN